MPYIIHNCVYEMTDAVKGQKTQKYHMIQKNTIKEIKKRFIGKKGTKKTPGNLGYLERWNWKTKPKDFVACTYISRDNNTQIAFTNSLIISTWQRDTMEADKHLRCSLLLSHGKNEIISAYTTTRRLLPNDLNNKLQLDLCIWWSHLTARDQYNHKHRVILHTYTGDKEKLINNASKLKKPRRTFN